MQQDYFITCFSSHLNNDVFVSLGNVYNVLLLLAGVVNVLSADVFHRSSYTNGTRRSYIVLAVRVTPLTSSFQLYPRLLYIVSLA